MKTILLSVLLFTYSGKRQIILFYNDQGITVKDKQLSSLNADKKGLAERDIVVHIYKTTETKEVADRWNIKAGSAFTFLLIGKDGSEKIRADTVVSLSQLYKSIDAMPMRRDEMKRQKQ